MSAKGNQPPPLLLRFEVGRVECDSELFESLLDRAEILGYHIKGLYPPGVKTEEMIDGIITELNRLRRRYENLQTAYYAEAWDSDEVDDDTETMPPPKRRKHG